jgi:transposase-like protein
VDETGKTQVLAVSVLLHEDTESFSWIFGCFSEAFQSQPVAAFTDSDAAMAAAIQEAWPNTVHLLCTFHLFKNFHEHIRQHFLK